MKDADGRKEQHPGNGQHFLEFTLVENQWNVSVALRECGNRETQLGSVKLGPGVDTCVLAQGEHCSIEYIKLSHPFYSLDGFLWFVFLQRSNFWEYTDVKRTLQIM